jgi:outer membrane protein OmpA-like peptidoglycan-associated protein
VVQTAARYALNHTDQAVVVAGYADPNGTAEANASVSSERSSTVTKTLIANGVPESRITRKSLGAVSFTLDSQEARRVEITVGVP